MPSMRDQRPSRDLRWRLDPSGGSSYDVTGFSSLYTACRISRRWTWSWSDQEWRWNQLRAYIGKVSYYDGCNWLFLFVSCFLIGSFLAIWLVQFPVMWLVGDIKPFNPLFELNKFIIGHIRSRIRAFHPSRGSPTGDKSLRHAPATVNSIRWHECIIMQADKARRKYRNSRDRKRPSRNRKCAHAQPLHFALLLE
jgi:hypothetical protein